MSVTIDDVRAMAALARLGVDDATARGLAVELNSILEHMEQLGKVDTGGVESDGVGPVAAPLRDDVVRPVKLERAIDDFAPSTRDGFFLVPRLSTHEDPEVAS